MIRHLGQKHSVVVASLAESEDELQDGLALQKYCSDLIAEVVPRSVRWSQAWKALFSRMPSSAAYFWSSRLHRRVQNALAKEKFDLVFVHCAFVAQYVINFRNSRKILDYGDLDSGKWLDYSRWRKWPLSWGYGFEGRKLREYERRLTDHFDHFTVTAPGELDELSRLKTNVPCTLIPNGVDTTYFSPKPSPDRNRHIIVFVGRMDYFPNIDGILYFTRKIYPLIKQSVADVSLKIVGSNPIPAVRDLAGVEGVTVTGHVPDVRPYLSNASVAVAPLRIARGTQNKILESMAMGIPVVATSQAAKGVQAVAGRHLVVADNPELFATQLIRLLNNPNLGSDLSLAARHQIETVHSWPASMEILDNVLVRLAA